MTKLTRQAAVYIEAIELARKNTQTVGENNDFFITLGQLNEILVRYFPKDEEEVKAA